MRKKDERFLYDLILQNDEETVNVYKENQPTVDVFYRESWCNKSLMTTIKTVIVVVNGLITVFCEHLTS